ncbi:hypothetical protein LCGC14_0743180 [marine sediment metagenome]|uniref:Phage protein n=1 Tax=marine sediment metagenome TaxID=412755 RepID=A0A0F9TD65_9ZZZZ
MARQYTLQEVRNLIKNDSDFLGELDEINQAIRSFAISMRDEMFDHAADGGGWRLQDDENEEHFNEELLLHIKKGKFIGAANFCMMLNRYPGE